MRILNRKFHNEALDNSNSEHIQDNYVFIQKTYIKQEDLETNKTFEETVWYGSGGQSGSANDDEPPTYPYWNYEQILDYPIIYFKNPIFINENWKENETLFAWGSEILTMTMLPLAGSTSYTLIPFKRGLYGTSTKHEIGEIIREVTNISELVTSINVNNQTVSISSDLYAPIVSNSYIEIQDENFNDWSPFLNGFMDGNAVYIYEKKDDLSNHLATLFLNKIDLNYDTSTINLELQNKYKFLIDKKMDKNGIIGKQQKITLLKVFRELIHQQKDSKFYFLENSKRIRYTTSITNDANIDIVGS